MIKVVWSERKNRQNIRKHKVDFVEAGTIFADPLQISVSDPDHSFDESRFITIGMSERNRLLIVAHTFRDDKIRIITARKPNRRERKDYEEGVLNA
ncbi:MAG TPA: BrnT family toxin [Pyrinomonadaceae bacterium]|nr:BrnT family toxin [Pyrinomonadaceae bacterium]